MLKSHYQNDTTVVCFKKIPRLSYPCLSLTGMETKLRPVEVAAENRNVCSLQAASVRHKSRAQQCVL